jgi:hypothetical protein
MFTCYLYGNELEHENHPPVNLLSQKGGILKVYLCMDDVGVRECHECTTSFASLQSGNGGIHLKFAK